MSTVADLVAALQSFAPLSLAAEWDNVGLLLGDPAGPVERIMTCLTVTPDSAQEAIDAKAQLIVSHHPILFRGTKRLTADRVEGRLVLALARAGVAVYSAHTAFDNAAGGINDILARKIGLTNVSPLRVRREDRQCKIVVFVPEKDLTKVSDAMFAAGAGQIGQYRECSFRIPGTGTFFGSESTNPTVGQKGRREEVAELRLEVLCPEASADRVVRAMRSAHSYEEPAYDVYSLRAGESRVGEGRLGSLPTPISLQEFAQKVKMALPAPAVQLVGWPGRSVQRIAIACGAAGEFLGDAALRKADVFLTGEVRFHDTLAAEAQEISLVLPGHYASERCGVEDLARQLQERFADVKVWASERERDPLSGPA
jgi:dinuclear metal center YbgI/SA1388 family protein